MSMIKWRNALSVKVAEVDKHHQKLINLINDLNDSIQSQKSSEVLGQILKELKDYTIMHFSFEEQYFDKFKYPKTQEHKKAHKMFVDKVNAAYKDFEAGKSTLSMELMMFLSDWLRNHIMGTDKEYSAFFNEHGLK